MNEHHTTLHIRGTRVYLDDSIVGDAKIRVRDEVPMTELKRAEINTWLVEMFGREERPIYKVSRGERGRTELAGVDGVIIGPALIMHSETWNRIRNEEISRDVAGKVLRSRLGPWGGGYQATMMYQMLGHIDIDSLMQE